MLAPLLALLLAQDLPEGLTAPAATCPGPPDYPASEKGTGVEGRVVLNITLDETGKVTKTEVFQSMNPAFDKAAVESSKKCTFTPATMKGKPLPSIVQLTADFVPPLKPWTLAGDVVGELGEPLESAEVRFGGQTTHTDKNGRFSLTFEGIPPGDGWVLVHLTGHADKAFPEVFKAGLTTRVRYQLPSEKTFETRVEGSRLLSPVPEPDRTPQVSKFTITKAQLDQSVGVMEDVTHAMQQAPGVSADPDLLSTLFVRGGGPDEVLFYLDGVPLSNPYHLGGFASIFNPMMLDTAEFYTGGVPARYEPALSGALEIHYATGETKKPHVLADVSMQTAMLRADIPMGIEGLSAVVSFRRSYFEAYFAILRATHIVGSNFFAPEITEATARINFRRGRHNTTLTYMFVADGVNLNISPGEQVILNFVGSLKLFNRLHLASLQHRIDFGGDSNITLQASYTHDANFTQSAEVLPGEMGVSSATMANGQQLGRTYTNNAERGDFVLRADGTIASEKNRTQAGLQYAHRNLHLEGDVANTTANPPWAAYPSVDTHDPFIAIQPDVVRDLLAIYGEHTYRPLEQLTLEVGGRGQIDAVNGQGSGTARVAVAWTAPIATVLKLSAGMAAQPVQQPLLLDPTYGNPKLTPERSWQVVAGLEQPLPFEALLRLEVWGKYLDNLVVNPDTPAGLQARLAKGEPTFVNAGTGFARGVDLLFVGRTRHFSYGLSAGLLASDRTNPLAEGQQTYPTPWDQRFTAAANLTWSPTDKWLVSGRFSFRTGRPYTEVNGFVPVLKTCTDANGATHDCSYFVPKFGEVNAARYPPFYELSLRVERRFTLGPLKMAVYGEVLNVTNAQNVFIHIWGTGDPRQGVQPDVGAVNHLPIRPFLGIRAEY